MTDNIKYEVTYLTGEKKLEPVKYWIETETIQISRLWGLILTYKDVYWLCTEFMRMGPMDEKIEIYEAAAMAGIKITEKEISNDTK